MQEIEQALRQIATIEGMLGQLKQGLEAHQAVRTLSVPTTVAPQEVNPSLRVVRMQVAETFYVLPFGAKGWEPAPKQLPTGVVEELLTIVANTPLKPGYKVRLDGHGPSLPKGGPVVSVGVTKHNRGFVGVWCDDSSGSRLMHFSPTRLSDGGMSEIIDALPPSYRTP